MNSILLESSSESTLRLVVELAQKLGVKIHHLGNQQTIDLKRQELESIIDAGGGIENPKEFLAEFEKGRRESSLIFRN